jgi:hypothetical protein
MNRLIIVILLLVRLTCEAQEVKLPFIIEPKAHTGIMFPFYKALDYLAKDDIYAFDLSICFPTSGKNYWEKLYNNPSTGFGYSYWNLGNNEVLGNANTIYSFINFPFLKWKEIIQFNYQISLGGAYLSKKFDVNQNHLDRAIGSHANIYFRLGIDGKIRLTPKTELILEAGATHFSNGKTKSPNYGINTGTFSVGLNYLFNNSNNIITIPEIPEIVKKYSQSILYSAGLKAYDNLLGKKYLTSSASYNLERQMDVKRKIGLGADLFYDGSIKEALVQQDGTPETDFVKLIRVGLHASYSVRYKRVVGGIQLGRYLYSKYIVLTPFYSRLSIQYLLSENIFGGVALKSHMGKADCLEFGAGYCW